VTPGPLRRTESAVPLSRTATAFTATSYSPVTCAPGALLFSHCLKVLRWATSLARSLFAALLSKSTFLPLAGAILGWVASGARDRPTTALVLSTPVVTVASELGFLDAVPGAAEAVTPRATPAMAAAPAASSARLRRLVGCTVLQGARGPPDRAAPGMARKVTRATP